MTRRTIFLAITIVIALVLAGLLYYVVIPNLQLRTLTQAELGLASVIVALLATIFSLLSVMATWRTVQEMKLAREAQERPYVIMDFDLSNPPIINLVISNIGNGAAKDVKFTFEPDPVTSDDRNISKSVLLFRDGISFFPPGKTISQFFDMLHAYLGANKPLTFDVTISYRDAQGSRKYKDFMRLDLSMFKGRHYIVRKGIHDLVKEIEGVGKTVKDTFKEIKRIAAKIDKGIPINAYEFHVISRVDKQTILSKLMEFHDVWTHFYLESKEPYMRLEDVKSKLLSLGREIANLIPACRELDEQTTSQILKIPLRMSDLGRFSFYGEESVERFNSQGAEILALIEEVKAKLRWEATKRLYYDHQQEVKTLTELIEEFASLEKAKCLADTIKGNVRVMAILRVEEGRIGVMLNIGRTENLQVGTQLLVRRIDRYTSDGQHIEQPLGLVRITYVQAENNLSQAVVLDPRDREFWDQATTQLRREKRIDPPKNFVLPYIPPELRALSLEELTIIRQYLEAIRDSLTGQVVQKQEEGLQ